MSAHDLDMLEPPAEVVATVDGLLNRACAAVSDEHFAGCPCGACQQVRAQVPPAPIPLAYHICCGAVVKLVREAHGLYRATETHLPSCKETQ